MKILTYLIYRNILELLYMIIQLTVLFVSILFFFNFTKTSLHAINTLNKSENNPVLKIGNNQSWDQNSIGSPSVIYLNNKFNMWFEGHDGKNWRIGYASSNNATSWVKNDNYVIDILDSLNDKNAHDPKVIFLNQKYLMWYASSDNSINNIHINFSSSLDEIHWNFPIQNVLIPGLIWETPKGISYPYVFFVNGKYMMWYGAHGNHNGRFAWRIGFATSDDGINWNKYPEPVLVADQAWEGSDVGNPSVLLEDEVYHMWYHADKDIGHAVSLDGIHWEKDPTNPVLKPGPSSWDLFRVMNPAVIKKDNTYYMFYTGAAFDGKWQIGLATTNEIFKPLITPILSPSLTPSPSTQISISPTPTTQISPTPSPLPFHLNEPIIFIPGLGASWNPFAIFSCQLSEKGSWQLARYAFVYQRFIKTLTKNAKLQLNKDFFIYAYDWRQPLDVVAEQFRKYIDQVLSKFPSQTKVKIVGHSLGGLVVRSYLTKYPDSHKVSTVITVGTPHTGTVLAYPTWENGEIWENNILIQIGLTQILTHCRIKRTLDVSRNRIFPLNIPDNKQVIHSLVPSIESLFPTFDFLRKNNTLISSNSLFYQNRWIKDHPFPSDFFHTTFISLSGNDKDTLRFIDIEDSSDSEKQIGRWIDGKPVNKSYTKEGDGTILHLSSFTQNGINEKITGDHVDIITSDEGISKILQYLNLKDVKPAEFEFETEVESDTALTITTDTNVSVEITDMHRKKYFSQYNITSLFNPAYGIYKINLSGNTSQKTIMYISLIEKGKEGYTIMKEISPIANTSQTFTLIYSRNSSTSLQLISTR